MKPPQTPGSIVAPRVAPAFYQCSGCRMAVRLPELFVDFYFENRPIVCSACHTKATAWEVALKTVKERFMFYVFYPLGAKTAIFRTKLFLNSETRFDLFAEGLPRN